MPVLLLGCIIIDFALIKVVEVRSKDVRCMFIAAVAYLQCMKETMGKFKVAGPDCVSRGYTRYPTH